MSMHALKWEDFSQSAAPTPAPAPRRQAPAALPQNAPDPAALETLLAKARGKARADGFAEGVAKAEARAETELMAILRDLSERLSDAAFTRQSAETELDRSLRRIAIALFRSVAPALAERGLAAEIAEAVAKVALDLPAAELRITVPAERRDRLAEVLAAQHLPVDVTGDPEMTGLTARVHWHGGFDAIDLDRCIAEAEAAIETYFAPAEDRSAHHG